MKWLGTERHGLMPNFWGDEEGQKLLQTTLEEEKQTDQKLSKLATSAINVAAAK